MLNQHINTMSRVKNKMEWARAHGLQDSSMWQTTPMWPMWNAHETTKDKWRREQGAAWELNLAVPQYEQ